MTVLPALERLLGDAAENLEPAPSAGAVRVGRPWWRGRSWRPLGLFAALVLAGCSAAWAAGVFRSGTPITTQPGYAPVANVGWGAPVPGSYRVLALRVSDPSGGPPWGVGFFRTTEGLACPTVGRIVDGRLGALGIDSAFADDGRFHQLRPAASIFLDCAPPDATGHVFLTGAGGLASASGEVAPDSAIAERPRCLFPGDLSRGRYCTAAELRSVFYGFLGPDARTVSYTYHGVRHTWPVSGPDGAYLVVLPAPAAVTSTRAERTGDVNAPVTIHVDYRGGRSCVIGGPNLECGTIGYQPGPIDMPPPDSLNTSVSISYHPALAVGLLPAGPAITIRFTARRAISNTRYSYSVQLQHAGMPRRTGQSRRRRSTSSKHTHGGQGWRTGHARGRVATRLRRPLRGHPYVPPRATLAEPAAEHEQARSQQASIRPHLDTRDHRSAGRPMKPLGALRCSVRALLREGSLGLLIVAAAAFGGTAAGSSGSFPPSIYPAPVHSRGGALAACPDPAGLEAFTAAERASAAQIARSYGLVSEASDLGNSDRAWWPQVRSMWRRPRNAVGSEAIYGSGPASRSDYAVIVRYSCGQALVTKSLTVAVGPRQTHPPYCGDCISQLFLVDRRGHALIYYIH